MPIITKPVDEGKEIHGKTYTKYYDKDKNSLSNLSKAGTMGTTSLGSTIFDNTAQNRIEKLNVEKEKSVLESKDIILEYIKYCNADFSSILTKSNADKTFIEARMTDNIIALRDMGIDPKPIIKDEYYNLRDAIECIKKRNDNITDEELEKKTSESIRVSLKLRLNYINHITTIMANMIKSNYKTLGLSEQELQVYLDNLSSEDNMSVKAVADLKDKIVSNKDKFLINNGESIDLRELGFGVIFGTSEKMTDGASNDFNQKVMLLSLQKAMRYDAVVVAHGDSEYKKQDNLHNEICIKMIDEIRTKINTDDDLYALNEYINLFFKQYKSSFSTNNDLPWVKKFQSESKILLSQSSYTDNNIEKMISEITNNSISITEIKSYFTKNKKELFGEYDDDYNYLMNNIDDNKYNISISYYILNDLKNMEPKGEYIWTCQPTRSLSGGPFTEVNELLRQLIKEGFKKIVVNDCNPGGHSIAKDILETPGVLINYSKVSNWIESSLDDDPNLIHINELEKEIRLFAESYNIDYDDDIYLNECYSWYMNNMDIINEADGNDGPLVSFLKKIVGAIIGFIKRIFNFFKLLLTKAKELFFGTSEKPKDTKTESPKKVKCPLINPKTKKIEEIEGSTRQELHDKAVKACNDIAAEIKRLKDNNEKVTKQMEGELKKMDDNKKKSSNESFSLIRSLLEFDAGDGTNQDDDTQVDIEDPDDTSTPTPEEPANDPAPTQDDDPVGATDIDMDDPDDGTSEPTSEPSNEPTPADDPAVDDPAGATDIDMDDPDTTPDVGADAGDGEYTLGDDGEDDPAGATDIDMDDPDAGDGEGNPEDDGEPEAGLDDDPTGATDIDMEDPEGGEGDGIDGGDNSADGIDNSGDNSQDQISGLKAIENELFENLTDKQKQIKIKELKNNYVDLFDRCDGIIDVINARKPSDETTAQIFEYINNTILDLQNTVHDYLEHTFATKSYLENDAQFKSYLNILNTINNILKELNINKK